MNKHCIHLRVLMALSACLLSLTFVSMAKSQSTNPQQKPMTKKELKWLIQNVKTAEDHQKLAVYYRQEAASLREESQNHKEMAEAYATGKKKTGLPGKLFNHCRNIADYYAKSAKKADKMAVMHEELAKQVSKQQESANP
jgi:hypothetical protein